MNANGNFNANANTSVATPVVTQAVGTPAAQGGIATAVPMAADAVLRFQRSGGLAGTNESWVLYQDGRLVDPQGNERQLGQAGVNTVMQAVDAAGFFNLNSQYGTAPGSDAYTYTITIQRNGQVHSVTTFDNAIGTPPALTTLLNTLQVFLGL